VHGARSTPILLINMCRTLDTAGVGALFITMEVAESLFITMEVAESLPDVIGLGSSCDGVRASVLMKRGK